MFVLRADYGGYGGYEGGYGARAAPRGKGTQRRLRALALARSLTPSPPPHSCLCSIRSEAYIGDVNFYKLYWFA